jgi:hypothetical protein
VTDAPENWLLSAKLRGLVQRIRDAEDEDAREALYADADRALAEADAEEEADVALPVWERDLEAIEALIAGWDADAQPLPAWDKAVLKRAFKAYKKRLKLVRLDDVSTSGGNPLSQGRSSSITGVRPPEQYPPEVWALLVKQGKLRDAGGGLLELATV